VQVPRLYREIQGREEGLTTMTRSRNRYGNRYFKLMVYFQENGITPPLRRESPPDGGLPTQEDTAPLTQLEKTKRAVLSDLNLNYDRAPSRHRYSGETMSFTFAVYVFSGAFCRFLREILDLPSE
jgi:hypothetical protein